MWCCLNYFNAASESKVISDHDSETAGIFDSRYEMFAETCDSGEIMLFSGAKCDCIKYVLQLRERCEAKIQRKLDIIYKR